MPMPREPPGVTIKNTTQSRPLWASILLGTLASCLSFGREAQVIEELHKKVAWWIC